MYLNLNKLSEEWARSAPPPPGGWGPHLPEDLVRRCVNAGPNYGGLWFECRDPSGGDTCRDALSLALVKATEGAAAARRLYIAAEGRRMGVNMLLEKEAEAKGLDVGGEEVSGSSARQTRDSNPCEGKRMRTSDIPCPRLVAGQAIPPSNSFHTSALTSRRQYEVMRDERSAEADMYVIEDADPDWGGGKVSQAFEGGWGMDVWRMLSSVI